MKKREPIFSKFKKNEFESICRERGLALTIQRRAILAELAGRRDHPTPDQIYDAIKERLEGVSRTTVYRALETFVCIGIARKISNPEAKARYDADTSRHHHLTCLHCGIVLDIHDGDLNKLKLPNESERGFEVIDYSVAFTGFCGHCRSMGGIDRAVTKINPGSSHYETS
ncbi:MAG: transcriptional repressor [Deltaproteobacteria bacterium]|jgi:Fur family peroxide stress response transcriptional regulator